MCLLVIDAFETGPIQPRIFASYDEIYTAGLLTAVKNSIPDMPIKTLYTSMSQSKLMTTS